MIVVFTVELILVVALAYGMYTFFARKLRNETELAVVKDEVKNE